MNHFYQWKPEYTVPFICIISVSIGFPIGWFLAYSNKVKKIFFSNPDTHKAWINFVFFQKMIGALFMGIIPLLIVLGYTPFTISDLGININNFSESLLYISLLGLMILIINL